MPCNECTAPVSTTNIYNSTMAVPLKETHLVAANLTITLDELPVDGGVIALFLDNVPQIEDVHYSVNPLTGTIQLIGATAGQTTATVYLAA